MVEVIGLGSGGLVVRTCGTFAFYTVRLTFTFVTLCVSQWQPCRSLETWNPRQTTPDVVFSEPAHFSE